jgi:hypothetical protein
MIQRIQTIWLLLAAACGFATLKLPFYIGSIGNAPAESFTAMSNTFLMILTVAAAIIALVALFLYNNRKLQFKIGITGLVVSILNIALYFLQAKKYDTGGIALFCVFAFAVPVLFILALRGIYKDEKLVKSVDRLR